MDEKRFVMDIIREFGIFPNGAHAAVTTFDSTASLEIRFSDHTTNADFEAALDTLVHRSGGTQIGIALETALNEMFQGVNGMRLGSPQIAVLITDGDSNDPVDYADFKRKFRAAHIKLVVVGIGNVNENDLLQLVETPDDLYLVTDFLALDLNNFIKGTTFCEPNIARVCHDVNLNSDVGFLMDVSGSVGSHWADEKTFVRDLVETLGLSATGTHAAVTTFDDQATFDISFSDHFTNQDFAAALETLTFRSGGTEIGIALEKALNEMFQEYNGMRSESPQTAVLITDGDSNSPVDYADFKHRFRAARIKLLVIGIGNVNENDLLQLVETPNDLYLVTDFLALDLNNFIKGTTFCEPNVARACQTVNSYSDVGFLMDVSGSVGSHWADEKTFVRDLVETLGLSVTGAHAAVTTFDDQATFDISFSDHFTNQDFAAALETLTFRSGGTEIGIALEKALNEMFQEHNGMRPANPQIAVLITDGDSNSPVDYISFRDRFREANIKLLVVGVGNVNENDLLQLVETSSDLLLVTDFLTLDINDFIQKTTFCKYNSKHRYAKSFNTVYFTKSYILLYFFFTPDDCSKSHATQQPKSIDHYEQIN